MNYIDELRRSYIKNHPHLMDAFTSNEVTVL